MPNEAQLQVYRAEDLRIWVSELFQRAGVRKADADQTAHVLVRTNLRGIDTHGVARVQQYLEKVLSGEVNANPSPSSSVRDNILFYNGDGGLGQTVATDAVREAVAMARDSATVICLIRGSGHLAALGAFALEAAEAGMVAFFCQETPPLMALPGSSRPSIGNNPIAFAAPVAGGPPLVFDMATSVVARGNVLQVIRDKQTWIPDGWAIGPDGKPTNDPAVALKGAMLPIADHKGVGLAMMVQVLAGSLSGSMTAASAATHGATSSAGNVSAFLMVINPDRFVGRVVFDQHMRDWIEVYRSASGGDARYPGERAAREEQIRRERGIPLVASVVSELCAIGEKSGHPFDLTPVA